MSHQTLESIYLKYQIHFLIQHLINWNHFEGKMLHMIPNFGNTD
uniref:Uncharacterized protein n=1 Tax=Human betaherpesvirus 6A TaxID=32603 RepID=A0A2L2QB55_9BETA|nr:hypothetical protein [Human betaherpesvirus 6A]AVI07652.1 hypothetical protein [Human betaherpesvirus 6A]AVI07773.1 hypothetical protein [Human betaherpesvirus 6A]AVI07894.1 hypothetical protein [Human betaherpesvirus 6A]AVI08023.1 hypothetical protein [Human betaherpesvirus 6A]